MEVLGGDMSLGLDTELKFEIKVDESQFPLHVPDKQSEGLNIHDCLMINKERQMSPFKS